MIIKVSDNDNSSLKSLTIDERQELIITIKNLTQSLSNVFLILELLVVASQSLSRTAPGLTGARKILSKNESNIIKKRPGLTRLRLRI